MEDSFAPVMTDGRFSCFVVGADTLLMECTDVLLAEGHLVKGVITATKRIREWAEKAGLAGRATAHALRHTFGTRLYERTGDLLIVQRALGHRDVSSTCIYAAASTDQLRAALGA